MIDIARNRGYEQSPRPSFYQKSRIRAYFRRIPRRFLRKSCFGVKISLTSRSERHLLRLEMKIRFATKSKLVQLLPLHNFRVHNFSRFCGNFCENLENLVLPPIRVTFVAFRNENLVCRQGLTCSAAKTEQLSCLQLSTVRWEFLLKSWNTFWPGNTKSTFSEKYL